MNSETLKNSLEKASGPAPSELSPEQQVLWLAKAGDWHGAHDIAQDLPDPHGSWLHAHLHRQEGDLGNAAYWYHRADRPTPDPATSIEAEWKTLVSFFCSSEKP